jgi:SAM-dependent methyltransferase
MSVCPRLPDREELVSALVRAPRGLDGRTLCAAGLVASAEADCILDVGCKSGWLLRQMAQQRHRPRLLVGVDLDLDRDALRSHDDFELARADARHLPFDDNSFDLVAALDIIEHVPAGDEANIVAGVARVLRPGGHFVLSTPSDWRIGTWTDPQRWLLGHRHYPLEVVVGWFGAAQLDVVLTETRGGWADVLGLPLIYATNRLRMPVPFGRRLSRWATSEYSRPGKYTHFVVGVAAP